MPRIRLPTHFQSSGAIDAEPVSHNGSHDRVYRIRDLVEKPSSRTRPLNLAFTATRSTPETSSSISAVEPGTGGRSKSTDAIKYSSGTPVPFTPTAASLGLNWPLVHYLVR